MMTTPLDKFVSFETADLDYARLEIARLYSPHEITLGQGAHAISARLNKASLNDLLINYIAYGAPVDVKAEGLADHQIIIIPLHGELRLSTSSDMIVADTKQAVIFPPERRLEFSMTADHDAVHLRIPQKTLENHLAILIGEEITKPINFPMALDLTRPEVARWLRLIDYAVKDLEAEETIATSVVSRELRDLLLTTLLRLQPNNYSEKFIQAFMPSNSSVAKAEEYIRTHAHEAVTIEKLAGVVGVSARALQIAFKRRHGITPLDYLRRARMEKIRADLLRIEPHESVAQITRRWGINHSGYFANEYHRRFGEKPSDTARRGAYILSAARKR